VIPSVVVEVLRANLTFEGVPGDAVRRMWASTEDRTGESDTRGDGANKFSVVLTLFHAEEKTVSKLIVCNLVAIVLHSFGFIFELERTVVGATVKPDAIEVLSGVHLFASRVAMEDCDDVVEEVVSRKAQTLLGRHAFDALLDVSRDVALVGTGFSEETPKLMVVYIIVAKVSNKGLVKIRRARRAIHIAQLHVSVGNGIDGTRSIEKDCGIGVSRCCDSSEFSGSGCATV